MRESFLLLKEEVNFNRGETMIEMISEWKQQENALYSSRPWR